MISGTGTDNAIDLLTTVIYAAANSLTLEESRERLQSFLDASSKDAAKRRAKDAIAAFDLGQDCVCGNCSKPAS